MKLSTEQLARLSERVFKVLKASGHISLDASADEKIEERTTETILNVLEDDARTEDKLLREAERLVEGQSHIAKSSGKTMEDLVEEVKIRLAKSKNIVLGDGPERADTLAEKVLKALWKLDGLDFFVEDMKIQNCIARALYRFRMEDDRVVDTVEKIVNKKSGEPVYSPAWCQAFDRCCSEVKKKLAERMSEEFSSL